MDRSLSALVDDIVVVPLTDDVLDLLRTRDRLDARVCESLSQFFGEQRHQREGWGSPVGWLRATAGLTDRDATRLVARARQLTGWPTLARAWFDGHLTGAQIEVACASVPRSLSMLWAQHETDLVPHLVGLSTIETHRAIREWVRRAESHTSRDPSEIIGAASPAIDSSLHLSRLLDDRGRLDADLDPDTTAVVEAALRVADRPDAEGELRLFSRRRAEALLRICRFFLDHHSSRGSRPGRQHPHVVVAIELADLYASCLRGLGIRTAAELEAFVAVRPTSTIEEAFLRDALAFATGTARTLDGNPLTPRAVTTIFGPGTTLERLLTTEGRVLDHGREIRLADAPLRDALLVRDQGCRFPGCDASAEWIHAHHLQHWEHDGVTSITNLAGHCGGHHGVVHRNGWSVVADTDGTLRYTRPDSTVLTSPPPRSHRPPPLPLHLEAIEQLLPARVDMAVDAGVDAGVVHDGHDGDDGPLGINETRAAVRGRVVDLLRHVHRRHPEPVPEHDWALLSTA